MVDCVTYDPRVYLTVDSANIYAINAEDYCPHDGVSDDQPGLAAAIAAAGGNKVVFLPGSTDPYILDSTLEIANAHLIGAMSYQTLLPTTNSTVLEAGAGLTGALIKCTGSGSLQNATLNANSIADYALHISAASGRTSDFTNTTSINATIAGVRFERCQAVSYRRIHAQANPIGFLMESCNHCVLYTCQANINTSHGIQIQKAVSEPGAGSYAHLVHCQAEGNGGDGIHVIGDSDVNGDYIQGAQIIACHLEANGGNGIFAQYTSHLLIEHCRLVGNPGLATDRCIYLTDSKNANVWGNSAGNVPGFVDWIKIANLTAQGSSNDFNRNILLTDIALAQALVVETS
jgi:hypothetical protein